jgi:hypothetical protein
MIYTPFISALELGFRRPTPTRRPTTPGRVPGIGRRPTTGPPPTQAPAPLDDFSADINTTGSIVPGGSIAGVINSPSDSDWFAITLQAGRTYTMSVKGISLSDTVLKIRDASGSFLVENDDINVDTNRNSQLQFVPKVSGAYFLDVRGYLDLTGSYELKVEEPAPLPPPPQPSFQIDIDYTGDPRFLPIFEAAAARWQQVITGDLPDVNGIDDLLITVNVGAIDGIGGTLGFAGPDTFRSTTLGGLPLTGSTTLDSADLASLEASGILDDTVLHEFGHILGIGTIWDRKGLFSGADYTGLNAKREYQLLGGKNVFVPLETNGGPGTAFGHWAEDVFDNELMTGFIDRQSNPLSKVTIGTLQDLGYTVNYDVADAYLLPSGIRSIRDQPLASGGAMDDILANSLKGCYCATCAAFSAPGTELARFSDQISRSQSNLSRVSFAERSVVNSGLPSASTTTDSFFVMPSYLTAEPLGGHSLDEGASQLSLSNYSSETATFLAAD